MTLNTVYRKSPENQVISFNYADYAQGVGYSLYYGLSTINDTTKDHHLSNVPLYSYDGGDSATTTASDFTKVIDEDFDLSPYSNPTKIGGMYFAEFTFSVHRQAGSSTVSGYFDVIIKRVSDGVETTIGTAQTQTITTSGVAYAPVTTLVESSITETSFKAGDILRITVEGWGKSTNGSDTCKISYTHDPINRDWSSLGIIPSSDDPETISQLKIHIPYPIQQ